MRFNAKNPDRVDMSDPEEVRAWSAILGVTEEELARAVDAAGNAALNLREHFIMRRSGQLSRTSPSSRGSLPQGRVSPHSR